MRKRRIEGEKEIYMYQAHMQLQSRSTFEHQRERERVGGRGVGCVWRDTCIKDTCRCEIVAHSSVMWENVNLARKAGVSVFVLCTSKESKLSTLSPTTLVTASKLGSGTKDCNAENVSNK